jgi:hypothetical protein
MGQVRLVEKVLKHLTCRVMELAFVIKLLKEFLVERLVLAVCILDKKVELERRLVLVLVYMLVVVVKELY